MARATKHDSGEILSAALLLFYEQGIKVPTSRIATAAGVSNGTLFHHFATKQGLIDSLYLSIKADLASAVGEIDTGLPLKKRMEMAWSGWLKWARNNHPAHVVGNLLHNSNLVSSEAVQAGYEIAGGPIDLMLEAQNVGLLVPMPITYLAALIPHHIDEAVKCGLSDEEGLAAFEVLWRGMTVDQD